MRTKLITLTLALTLLFFGCQSQSSDNQTAPDLPSLGGAGAAPGPSPEDATADNPFFIQLKVRVSAPYTNEDGESVVTCYGDAGAVTGFESEESLEVVVTRDTATPETRRFAVNADGSFNNERADCFEAMPGDPVRFNLERSGEALESELTLYVAYYSKIPDTSFLQTDPERPDRVWYGTLDQGLLECLDREDVDALSIERDCTRFDVASGLPSNNVSALNFSSVHGLAVGTVNGAAIIGESGTTTVVGPGGEPLEVSVTALLWKSDGSLVLGAADTLYTVSPTFSASESTGTDLSGDPVLGIHTNFLDEFWVRRDSGLEWFGPPADAGYVPTVDFPATFDPITRAVTDEEGGHSDIFISDGADLGRLSSTGTYTSLGSVSGGVTQLFGHANKLWVGQSNGLQYLSQSGGGLSTISEFNGYSVTSLGRTSDRVLATVFSNPGTSTPSLAIIDPTSGAVETLYTADETGTGLLAVASDPVSNTVWLAGNGRGLVRLKSGSFMTYEVSDGLPSGQVNLLRSAPNGSVWAATTDGVVHFLPSGRVNSCLGDGGGCSTITANLLHITQSGEIFIVNSPSGSKVRRYNATIGKFNAPLQNGSGSDLTLVTAIAERPDGTLLIGTQTTGLWHVNGVTGEVLTNYTTHPASCAHEPFYLPKTSTCGASRWIKDILVHPTSDDVWFGTRFAGAVQYNDEVDTPYWNFLTPNSSTDLETQDIAVTADGKVWVGTAIGLARYSSDGTLESVPAEISAAGVVSVMLAGSDGALYVGTRATVGGVGTGLLRIEGDEVEQFNTPVLPHATVNALIEVNGKILIGTSDGLAVLDPATGTIEDTLTTATGDLPNDIVRSLTQAANGSVWVGTDEGIAVLTGL